MSPQHTRSTVSRFVQLVAVLVLLICGPALGLRAQNTTAGALTGTVTDSSGALVPNAAVKVTNQATRQVKTATTTGKGFYDVENLPDGDYSIAIAAGGFQQVTITGLHLDPGQRRGQDVSLKTGSTEIKVNVEGNSVAVDTESPESGGTISAKEVANLMINGRNFQQLATLVPGVSSVNGTNQQVNSGYLGQTDLIVGGASSEETTYTIDGVYNMTPTSLININITPSIDAINELRVLKNSYSARYGFAGSGQILIETKSGGSQFHGTGYEYVRNNSLGVAKPYSITGLPTTSNSLHLNIYGFTLGGPVYIPKLYNKDKNKTFFFVGAEFKTNHYATSYNSRSEFTQAIRNGDLSLSHDAQYCNTTAYTSQATAAGCTGATATDKFLTCAQFCQNLLTARGLTATTCLTKDGQGVTNQVNPACYDPASAYFINPANLYMPLPNIAGVSTTSSLHNYINTNPELDSQNDTIYKIDHHIGDKHVITLRYMHEEVYNVRPAREYNDPAPNPGASVYTPALNMLARWSYNITPSFINTAGLAYTDQKVNLFPTGQYTVPSGLIKNVFANGDNRLPAANIGGYWSWLGVGVQPNYSRSGDGIFSDDVTLSKGRHVIQFGGLYIWNILRTNASAFSMGNFSFGGGITTTTGDTAADFLLGMASGYSQSNTQRAGVFHQHWSELYAQDDWKLNPRTTLSYGVRYSFYSPTTKEGNDITNFNPASFNPAVAPAIVYNTGQYVLNGIIPVTSTGAVANYQTNGVVNACQNGTPCGFTTPKKNLFAPRLGFAYRLNDNGTMSLHGGYGVGYTQVGMFQTSNLLSNNPYVSTPTFSYAQFSNPGGGTPGAPGVQSLSATDSTYRPAMAQNWSLSFEDEVVRHGIMNITYAGDKVDHIFSNSVDRNFVMNTTSNISATVNSTSCAASSPTPSTPSKWQFDPCLNTGAVNANYERPYPGFAGITTGVSIGQSNYHGLQTGFVYRLADLQLNEAYTYSKALGNQNQNAAGNLAYGFDSNIGFQNPRNPGGDYGRPNYDRTHVFTSAYVYQLPFFRHSNLLLREVLGGFSTSGLITAQSGFTQSVGLSTSTNGQANRPNQIAPLVRNPGSGKVALGQMPLYSYTSFAQPAYGTFGNSEPGLLRGPKEISFATAINKNFAITERAGLVLRAEVFNLFNHPNINGFGSSWSNSTSTNQSNFGYATSAGDMRQMEFSARVNF